MSALTETLIKPDETATCYPRPDFQRCTLNWQSLNGPWDFLFDDEDVGLSQQWQLRGIPDNVSVKAPQTLEPSSSNSSQDDPILQRIAAGTQDLIQNNVFSSPETVHEKRSIIVPFVFQSPASGINDRGVHEVLWYERAIEDPRTSKNRNDRVLLRFGAVDYQASVWVNGQPVGTHRGGHVPFELDISDALDAAIMSENSTQEPVSHRLTVRVYDSAYDLTQPRGKQYWAAQPESIFYTPSGGIWQSIWLEVVPRVRIGDSTHGTVINSTDIQGGNLDCLVAILGRRAQEALSVEVAISFGGIHVSTSARQKLTKETDTVRVSASSRVPIAELWDKLPRYLQDEAPVENDSCWKDGVALWSPEHPLLYDVKISLFLDQEYDPVDEILTTVGMRSLGWFNGDGQWHLNGRPYFQALCLDQGYWPESFMTPPTPDSLRQDIELAKKMGFNGCRKHQKVEDPIFYYWADKLGYLVWGEMASAYRFSPEYVDRFNQEWIEAVKLVINHPCVVTWTPVNESWGYPSLKDSAEQRNHIRTLYYMTKTLDPTRSINDNCGWEHVCTDLTTFHDYSDGPDLAQTCASHAKILDPKAGRDMFIQEPGTNQGEGHNLKHHPGAPIMCTEFGGVNIAQNKTDDERAWGYTTAQNSHDLLLRFERLVNAVVDGGICCAFVYTQLTDIEQETNGLYSFDRKEKMDASIVKAVIDGALQRFYHKLENRG